MNKKRRRSAQIFTIGDGPLRMRRRAGSAIFIVAAVVLAVAPVLSRADRLEKLERQVAFNISAGSLESALIAFSRQSHLQVVIGAPVANIAVAAIEGRRHPRDVLVTLLSDTGLTFRVVGETVTVYNPDPLARQTEPPPLHKPSMGTSQTSRPN